MLSTAISPFIAFRQTASLIADHINSMSESNKMKAYSIYIDYTP